METPMIIHTARGGESPHDIARKYSVPLTKLLADNRHGGRLAEGEELLVLMPTKTAIVAGNDKDRVLQGGTALLPVCL